MGEIKVLDCTLRDGGRLFDNAFGDNNISTIINGLTLAGIEYIEIGFFKFKQDISCRENTTFFERMDEMVPFLSQKENPYYLAMIENVFFEQDMLPTREDNYVDGIRLCVTKEEFRDAKENMLNIKNKGYHLFVQCTNTLGYAHDELEEFISIINEVKPFAFGLVDTYGAMGISDFKRILGFLDEKLNKDIALDIHLHNNRQMAFAFACMAVEYPMQRECIIDSTLLGMGMGAGNLNTEMIVQYLNSTISCKYNLSEVISLLEYPMKGYREKYYWGADIITFIGTEKRVAQLYLSSIENGDSKIGLMDKCKMVASNTWMEKVEINRFVKRMHATSKATHDCMVKLKKIFENREILLVTRGPSAERNKEKLREYVKQNNAIVLYVNKHLTNWFDDTEIQEIFFLGNQRHFDAFKGNNPNVPAICYADVKKTDLSDYVLDGVAMYKDIELCSEDSTINALNMLKVIGWKGKVGISGFDGGDADVVKIKIIKRQLEKLKKSFQLEFLTESRYGGDVYGK